MGEDAYYELLCRYIKYVRQCAGTAYIVTKSNPAFAKAFLEDEWDTLAELEQDAMDAIEWEKEQTKAALAQSTAQTFDNIFVSKDWMAHEKAVLDAVSAGLIKKAKAKATIEFDLEALANGQPAITEVFTTHAPVVDAVEITHNGLYAPSQFTISGKLLAPEKQAWKALYDGEWGMQLQDGQLTSVDLVEKPVFVDAQNKAPGPYIPTVPDPDTLKGAKPYGIKALDEPQDFAALLAQTFAINTAPDDPAAYHSPFDDDDDDEFDDLFEEPVDPLHVLPIGAPHPTMSWLEKHLTGVGQLMWVHAKNACNDPEQCCIHHPTDPRQDWPTKWVGGRMMRVCPHGYEHPDKDHLAYIDNTNPFAYTKHHTHTCCPTCQPECKAVIG